jgi:hypothetical protein
VLENPDEMFGARPRVIPISGIERGLPTTGLTFREIDRVSDPSQHSHRINRDFGQQLVHKARDEEGDFSLHVFRFLRPQKPGYDTSKRKKICFPAESCSSQ